MNELQRVAYLDAMGVTTYMPRVALPGAKPSELCDLTGCEVLVAAAPPTAEKAQTTVGKAALQQLQNSLATPKKAASRVVPAPAPRVANHAATPSRPAMAVHFQWAILQPVPALLVLVPAAQLGNAEMSWLKKILAAVGVSGIELVAREQFVWPPAAVSVTAYRSPIGHTLEDARETLLALLQGYQRKTTSGVLQHVFVFDAHLGKTLLEGVSMPGLTLRILPSLQDMSVNSPEKIAEAKRQAWLVLKDLKIS